MCTAQTLAVLTDTETKIQLPSVKSHLKKSFWIYAEQTTDMFKMIAVRARNVKLNCCVSCIVILAITMKTGLMVDLVTLYFNPLGLFGHF